MYTGIVRPTLTYGYSVVAKSCDEFINLDVGLSIAHNRSKEKHIHICDGTESHSTGFSNQTGSFPMWLEKKAWIETGKVTGHRTIFICISNYEYRLAHMDPIYAFEL